MPSSRVSMECVSPSATKVRVRRSSCCTASRPMPRSTSSGQVWSLSWSPRDIGNCSRCTRPRASDKPTSIEAYVDDAVRRDVTALFDHLSLDGAVVVGYSMGADIALRSRPMTGECPSWSYRVGHRQRRPGARAKNGAKSFIAGLEADNPDDEASLLGEFKYSPRGSTEPRSLPS